MSTTPSSLVRENIARGVGIPRELYLSPELFDREVDAMFHNGWLMAGHVSQLTEPGQYLTVEAGAESVVVARTGDGTLAAFHNTCRHRGARVVEPGCGQAARFSCPYHQWTYGTDGSLLGAPKMPAGFDKSSYGLLPVHVTTWHGLVFVTLAAEPAEPLAQTLAPVEDYIAPYALAGARVAHVETYEVAANWKVVWENAQECYHCTANHPELMRTFNASRDSGLVPGRTVRSTDGRVQGIVFGLKGDAVSLTMDGRPASGRPLGEFAGGRAAETVAVHLKPSFALIASPDYAVVLAERPLTVDRTEVVMSWLVAPDAEEGRDYDRDALIAVWDATNRQDWELCARTQTGIRSQYFRPGPLAPDEESVAVFHHAYAELLSAAGL